MTHEDVRLVREYAVDFDFSLFIEDFLLRTKPPEIGPDLAGRVVNFVDLSSHKEVGRGRRMRAFSSLVVASPSTHYVGRRPQLTTEMLPFWEPGRPVTYGELLSLIETSDEPAFTELREDFTTLQLSTKPLGRDAELHVALQDLGDEINEDVHEACAAFDEPDLWYPGVDEGITPVTDAHVELVITMLQRELDRELRTLPGQGTETLRPAAPLAALPWRIQRAVVERRRLRYLEFGITRERWASGTWNLWEIPEDPEWLSRRTQRLAGVTI